MHLEPILHIAILFSPYRLSFRDGRPEKQRTGSMVLSFINYCMYLGGVG
jgi:hypothetical protein